MNQITPMYYMITPRRRIKQPWRGWRWVFVAAMVLFSGIVLRGLR